MKLFIGCSSRNDILENYKDDCEKYLNKLFENNDLVFGADNTGLMGLAHDVAKSNNKQIEGICPKIYQNDFKNLNCTKEVVTETTIDRINQIINESDALIFLPGGIGTMAEFFASVDSKRCHEFDKPIVIYDGGGYYEKLKIVLEDMAKQMFISSNMFDLYHFSNSALDTLEYIDNYYKKLESCMIRKRK